MVRQSNKEDLLQEIDITQSMTGLSKEEVEDFLDLYGHTEIRLGSWKKKKFYPKEIWVLK